MLPVCCSYVLVCDSYVTRMYSYVFVLRHRCVPASYICYYYVVVCYPYVSCGVLVTIVDRYVIAQLNCGFAKIFCANRKNFSSVFSLADFTLEKQLSTQENWIQVQFQRALMALHHRPVFADKKVIICALCFIQFVVYSMRNPVVYRTAKKVVFC